MFFSNTAIAKMSDGDAYHQILKLKFGDWLSLGSSEDDFIEFVDKRAIFQEREYSIDELVFLRVNLPLESFSIKALQGVFTQPGGKIIYTDSHFKELATITPMYAFIFYSNIWSWMKNENTEQTPKQWQVNVDGVVETFDSLKKAQKYAKGKIK